MEVGDGTNTLKIHGNGITFADSTTQSTAVNGSLYLLLSGGAMSGALQLGGDLACDGYNLSGGNFSSPAGQVNCQNLTLTNGDGGSVTFADGSVQTTAASAGLDLVGICNAGITSALAIAFVSYDGTNNFTFNCTNAAVESAVLTGQIGVTQDFSTFYPFDSSPSTGVVQASTFSYDGFGIYLSFKDNSGTWHTNTSARIF
jgi:hypothetical protein